MTHPTFRRLAVAALAMAGLAACQPSTGGALTREEYIEQANAICTEGNAAIEAAMPAGMTGMPTGAQAEALQKAVVAEITKMVDRIEALEPPADMAAEMDSITADTRKVTADLEASGPDALFTTEQDPFADVNARLIEQGLTVCGEEPE
jgi:hypothetical protein